MSNESLNQVDRRTVLRLGGMSVALGAVLAACGAGENGGTTGVGPEGIPQIGTAPPLKAEGSKVISDARLLRTATSMHYNGIDAIDRVLALGFVSYDVAGAARGYRGLLQQQADALAAATTAAGAKPYEQKNAAIDPHERKFTRARCKKIVIGSRWPRCLEEDPANSKPYKRPNFASLTY